MGEVQSSVAVVTWNVIKKEEVIAVGMKNWQVEWVSARNLRLGMKMKTKMKMKKMTLRYKPMSIHKYLSTISIIWVTK